MLEPCNIICKDEYHTDDVEGICATNSYRDYCACMTQPKIYEDKDTNIFK